MNLLKIRNKVIGEGTPKMIVPLMEKKDSELVKEIQKVKSLQPDMIEWRADVYEHIDSIEAVQAMLTKLRSEISDELLLFTFRSHKEGGNKEISADYYKELLQAVIRTGKADLVDIELFSGDAMVRELTAAAEAHDVYVIMSNHNFQKTPPKEEIIYRLRKMQELGAHIPKMAVMPNSVEDVLTLLDATNTMKTKYADRPIITMSMGGMGLISRLSGELFGSAATFGAGEEASAPGQIPVSELRTVLEILHKNM